MVFESTNAGNHEAYMITINPQGHIVTGPGNSNYVSLDQIIFKVAA